ncbi:glycoside hydrolase family 3 protein [Sphingomonas sp. MS122]|uniref:glycoside hydrolase family 3 protein n=1 Tax=Sphingomonas sp. MS122 TaxID=3412683 RepID=UPI003C30CA24
MRKLARCVLTILTLGSLGAAPPDRPAYRDLNRNGAMDPYENPALPIEARLDDLLARMTLEEKVGQLLHGTLPAKGSAIGASVAGYDLDKARELIAGRHVSSFITRLVMPPADFAAQNNAVQKMAEATRLGIPVTISTDPRHHFHATAGASTNGGGFSQWPETLAFAAISDPALVRRFGDAARREYRAVGIHMALSPQADIGSEPRWPRITATFGSDPAAVSRLAGAYVEGFQGGSSGVTRGGVAAVVKHWVGYGAAPEGYDGHNFYGRAVSMSDGEFAKHVEAFNGAFAVRAAGVMPTYVIVNGPRLNGAPLEPVGAGFSKQLLTELLRREKGYGGLIISDWAITRDCDAACTSPSAENQQLPASIGMPWGVEHLAVSERFAKGLDAGLDQFGGVDDPEPLLAAVRAGKIAATRIDASVRRILRLKFELGLFEQPFVDPSAAAAVLGNPAVRIEAEAAQRAGIVMLRNADGMLPLRAGTKLWLYGMDAASARAAGFEVVTKAEDADVALVRTATPFEMLHPHHFFGSRQHEGRLDFRADDPDTKAIAAAARHVPVIVAVEMDRPAILTALLPHSRAIVVTFGASESALLDVVRGHAKPRGRLPFDLPRSMEGLARSGERGESPLFYRGEGFRQ